MQQKLLHKNEGQRTFALVLETGEEAMGCLISFANEHRISSAQITGIGAFSRVSLKYFDWDKKDYQVTDVGEQVEVASLIGDIAMAPSGGPSIHVHLVLGKRNGTALAGHLGSAAVRPTLEIIITESAAHLRKRADQKTGLALIDLEN
jgi:predicted DNA-binding protein with PD1-like motif